MSSHPSHMSQTAAPKKLLTYGLVSRRKEKQQPQQRLQSLTATTTTKKHSLTLSSTFTASSSSFQQKRAKASSSTGTSNRALADGESRQKRCHDVAFSPPRSHSRRSSDISTHAAVEAEEIAKGDTESTTPHRAAGQSLPNKVPPYTLSPEPSERDRGSVILSHLSLSLPNTAGHDVESTPPRRRRLIDALAAQRSVTPEYDDDEPRCRLDTRPQGSPPSLLLRRSAVTGQDLRARSAALLNRKIKRTYSRSTSMLSENLDLGPSAAAASVSIHSDSALADPHALAIGSPGPSTTDNHYDDEPCDDNSHNMIKSVHELRRAGANHRFADELDDLLARIGKPDSTSLTTRRSALCELAHKLPRESFCRQFCDHPARDKVARGVGVEKDVISAFLLSSALTVFLATRPAPHLLRQLVDEGLGNMLCRLLRYHDDIDNIASQKETHLLRTTRTSLHGIKLSLLRDASLWHGLSPARLSPRTLALRLLETVCHCADAQLLEHFACDVWQEIVLAAAEGMAAPRIEGQDGTTVDFALVVFSLDLLSASAAAASHNDTDRVATSATSLPRTAATLLQRVLHQWPAHRGELEAATLRLAINTTNGPDGAAAFHESHLLSLIISRICLGFHGVQDALVGDSRLRTDLCEELLLILGVMINIVEHSPRARLAVGHDALDSSVKLWQANRLAAGEADSMEKSQVGLAVGYLSVLLGYLCLERRTRARIDVDGAVLQPLILSISQFAAVHRSVGSKVHELESLLGQLELCIPSSTSYRR